MNVWLAIEVDVTFGDQASFIVDPKSYDLWKAEDCPEMIARQAKIFTYSALVLLLRV